MPLACRPIRFSLAAAALAKLGHRPRGRQAQRILAEMDRRLEGADARVSRLLLLRGGGPGGVAC